MIKFTVTNALVHSVSPEIDIPSRNGGRNFVKRELIIDDSWDKEGKHYPNFVLVEFTGDRMAQLDQIFPGMRVKLDVMLTGREYNGRIYNTIKGQSVTPAQPQQQYSASPSPAPMPVSGNYPQQQTYPAQPQQYAQASSYPSQQFFGTQAPAPGVADLPFPH